MVVHQPIGIAPMGMTTASRDIPTGFAASQYSAASPQFPAPYPVQHVSAERQRTVLAGAPTHSGRRQKAEEASMIRSEFSKEDALLSANLDVQREAARAETMRLQSLHGITSDDKRSAQHIYKIDGNGSIDEDTKTTSTATTMSPRKFGSSGGARDVSVYGASNINSIIRKSAMNDEQLPQGHVSSVGGSATSGGKPAAKPVKYDLVLETRAAQKRHKPAAGKPMKALQYAENMQTGLTALGASKAPGASGGGNRMLASQRDPNITRLKSGPSLLREELAKEDAMLDENKTITDHTRETREETASFRSREWASPDKHH